MDTLPTERITRMNDYDVAKQMIEHSTFICQTVINHVDGSNAKERKLISDAREKLSHLGFFQESLRDGSISPAPIGVLVMGLMFLLLIDVVNSLDASSSVEREVISLAKSELRSAYEGGYPPAVDLYNKGRLPIW